jgi:hypothetical protein
LASLPYASSPAFRTLISLGASRVRGNKPTISDKTTNPAITDLKELSGALSNSILLATRPASVQPKAQNRIPKCFSAIARKLSPAAWSGWVGMSVKCSRLIRHSSTAQIM